MNKCGDCYYRRDEKCVMTGYVDIEPMDIPADDQACDIFTPNDEEDL